MKNRHLTLATLAAAAALGACTAPPGSPYAAAYALYQTDTKMPTEYTRPAWVWKIDGKEIIVGRNDPVTPGMHEVTIGLSGPLGTNNTASDTIRLDTKPCTRYYFSSRRSTNASNDWKAYVSGTEEIKECSTQLGKGA